MNSSGDAAEQVVRLSLEGAEVAAKITGEVAKNIAILLISALKQEQKTKGKARLTNMIKSGKELVDIIARAEDASKIERIQTRFNLTTVDVGSVVKQSEKAIESKMKKAEQKENENAEKDEFFDEVFSDNDTAAQKSRKKKKQTTLFPKGQKALCPSKAQPTQHNYLIRVLPIKAIEIK